MIVPRPASRSLWVTSAGVSWHEGRQYRSAVGRNGISQNKLEGDGITPAGSWCLRRCYYRADRLLAPKTKGLPVFSLGPRLGWCDDPAHSRYNTLVRFPFAASAENLWRADSLYDLIIVLGYNDTPPEAGLGSAIFMHVARANFTPTEGCVALAKPDLLAILRNAKKDQRIIIGSSSDGLQK